MWLKKLIANHVLTNLVFALILVMGSLVYMDLPREQDPTVNFNWVQITTILPGASATDIEKKVTDVLEEALETVQDIKFVSSTSREGISSILVRFTDIDEARFNKRMADLRREINTAEDDLPIESERPDIYEVTTANAFPTATVVITGPSNDENLRQQARALEKDLARVKGVDRVQPTGLLDPELQIRLDIDKIQQLGISPLTVSDTLRGYFADVSAGTARIANDQWLIRVEGTTDDADKLAQLPLPVNDPVTGAASAPIRLYEVADVVVSREKADRLVRFQGKPAVLFAVMKQAETNTLELVERINEFVYEQNKFAAEKGTVLTIVDDQTLITRNALSVMQNNAMFGLLFVLIVTWFFLGSRMSILVTIGIPFTLAGTFIALMLMGQTLNTSVLLAIVIALGMLVDDAVVVVESIHHKLRQGIGGMRASWEGLTDVIGPVTASVLTTMAAFLPLMLLPGILGKFMMIIPLVVTTALAISLIEAYWMLPGHILVSKVSFDKPSKVDQFRQNFIRNVRIKYGFALIKVMRWPKTTMVSLVMLFILSLGAIGSGMIRMDFFASDTLRLFYINVVMPPSSTLDTTIDKVLEVENAAKKHLKDYEVRSLVSYSGQAFTETAPEFGEHLGQIMVSLKPRENGMRSVEEIMEDIRPEFRDITGPQSINFLKLSGGPPTSKAINVKVRGDDFTVLRQATDELKQFMLDHGGYTDVTDDDSEGRNGLTLTLNGRMISQHGLNPTDIHRMIKILVDGEIVTFMQHEGDKVALRVRALSAVNNEYQDLDSLLSLMIPTPAGVDVPLSELVERNIEKVKGNIRHYNFRRTITVEADIDNMQLDTVSANQLVIDYWASIGDKYPGVNLDFTGELDDIEESLSAITMLFMFGVGLMYLILSTQFQSYFQPLMILVTVPLAFTGVILGLIVSQNPLSLFTMYGIVALAGIAVNAAIVLISTANSNLNSGMSLIHSTFYAARRRVLPIMITTLTTVAGLLSLAAGWGGKSLLWSPVANSIVWGLLFSSFLTLFVIPVIYQISMQRKANSHHDTQREKQ